MGMGNSRAFLETLGRGKIIMLAQVLNESQREIEMPVVWIVANAFANEGDGSIVVSGAAGWGLIEKGRSPLVRNYQIGIERGCNIEQRSQCLVLHGTAQVLSAEILHDAHPVDV